jgi:hypothetical protein
MPANTAVESRPRNEPPKGNQALAPAQKRLQDQITWYAAVPDPKPLLGERVEAFVSYESWASDREEGSGRIGGGA